MDRSKRGPVLVMVGIIRLYQLTLSPWIGGQCRFYPTCSVYAQQALHQHGFIKGTWLAVRRVGRCHPFNPGGVDEVPVEKKSAC